MCRCPGSSTQSSRSSTSSPRSRPASRSRFFATSAGSPLGLALGATSSLLPTPTRRSAGATSSARTRPASGRTHCCPGAGRPAAPLHRATPDRGLVVSDPGLEPARRDDLRLGRRGATPHLGAFSRCAPRDGRAPDLAGIDWFWVFHNLVVRPGSSSWSSSSRRSSRSPASGRSRTSGRGCARDSILREPRRYLREVVAWQALDWAFRLAAIYFALRAFGMPSDS